MALSLACLPLQNATVCWIAYNWSSQSTNLVAWTVSLLQWLNVCNIMPVWAATRNLYTRKVWHHLDNTTSTSQVHWCCGPQNSAIPFTSGKLIPLFSLRRVSIALSTNGRILVPFLPFHGNLLFCCSRTSIVLGVYDAAESTKLTVWMTSVMAIMPQ